MKTRDRKELFAKNDKELRKALKEAKDTLFNFSIENKQNKLKNTRQIFWKKKEIAWILTALREKQLIEESKVK